MGKTLWLTFLEEKILIRVHIQTLLQKGFNTECQEIRIRVLKEYISNIHCGIQIVVPWNGSAIKEPR